MSVERPIEAGNSIVTEFQRFKENAGYRHTIGIIGGSAVENITPYRELLTEQLAVVRYHLGTFAIVSGGTQGGVPEMALDIGNDLQVATIGVFPEKGAKHAVPHKAGFTISVAAHPLSELSWGVETQVLASLPDVFILTGQGRWGTSIEASMIMKRNEVLLKKGLRPKPIISLDQTSILSQSVENLVREFNMPDGVFYVMNHPEEIPHLILSSL